eukprot:474750-Rhodomonas_salina.3
MQATSAQSCPQTIPSHATHGLDVVSGTYLLQDEHLESQGGGSIMVRPLVWGFGSPTSFFLGRRAPGSAV